MMTSAQALNPGLAGRQRGALAGHTRGARRVREALLDPGRRQRCVSPHASSRKL